MFGSNSFLRISACWVTALPLLSVAGCGSAQPASEEAAAVASQDQPKATIGATATVVETQSTLPFLARVDTGATFCSMHFEEIEIEDVSENMADNIGKRIRIKLKNELDNAQWIETKIEDCYTVKTSEKYEQRYKVPMELIWKDVKKEVSVTLNDRSRMSNALLLGRNFLHGNILVDVELKE